MNTIARLLVNEYFLLRNHSVQIHTYTNATCVIPADARARPTNLSLIYLLFFWHFLSINKRLCTSYIIFHIYNCAMAVNDRNSKLWTSNAAWIDRNQLTTNSFADAENVWCSGVLELHETRQKVTGIFFGPNWCCITYTKQVRAISFWRSCVTYHRRLSSWKAVSCAVFISINSDATSHNRTGLMSTDQKELECDVILNNDSTLWSTCFTIYTQWIINICLHFFVWSHRCTDREKKQRRDHNKNETGLLNDPVNKR